jgi:hypothetical protein
MPTIPPEHTLIPRRAHVAERVEPVLERARRDHPLVVLGAAVDVVVVVVEPRLGELPRLLRRQHPERHAGLEPHRPHALHDLDDRRHVAILGIAPRGAHAEPLAPRILACAARWSTSCTSSSLVASTPLSAETDCAQ